MFSKDVRDGIDNFAKKEGFEIEYRSSLGYFEFICPRGIVTVSEEFLEMLGEMIWLAKLNKNGGK